MGDKAFDHYQTFRKREISPLSRQRRDAEVCRKLEAYLEAESEPDVRRQIYSDLSLFSFYGEGRTASLQWQHRRIDEWPDDPLAWGSLATWYLMYCRDGDQRAEDLSEGLRHSETAVEKACAQKGLSLRHVLFSRCRIAAAAGRVDVIEEAMTAVLKTLPINKETPDIPYLEYDWLTQLPEGLVDPELVARYKQAAKETNRSYKKSFPDLYGDDA